MYKYVVSKIAVFIRLADKLTYVRKGPETEPTRQVA